ncbi:MAG: hypothetical protein IKD47_03585 [Clostridia bacterium]|nr:hypothetical protein [Clostridia bacterium]
MNTLFSVIFLICTALLLFVSPDAFLETLLSGASKAATTCVSLIATYAVWLGLMRVWEDSGVARGISRLLRPITKKLLKTDEAAALDAACMNLSVNLLGISGAATPYGIKAANLLDKTPNAEYSSAMLFVLNATSLQLLPTSMIAVRVSMHSGAPTDIVLPTLITTVFSTLLGALLVRLFIPIKTPDLAQNTTQYFRRKIAKTRGAGTQ